MARGRTREPQTTTKNSWIKECIHVLLIAIQGKVDVFLHAKEQENPRNDNNNKIVE